MQVGSDCLFAEELFEEFAMGNIAEHQLSPLEEHLLVCLNCQLRLEDIDDYVHVLKAAAGELEMNKRDRKPRFWEIMSGRSWHVPNSVLAVGLAAALAFAVAIPFAHQNVPETEVYLSTLRGAETGASVRGNVRLKIDTSTIADLPAFELQLVSSDGSEIWKSWVVPQNGQIVASVPGNLGAGRYWVRLYSETNSARPLEEFALQLK